MPKVYETEMSFMPVEPSAHLCVCPRSGNCDRPRPSAKQMPTKEGQLGGLKETRLPFVSDA